MTAPGIGLGIIGCGWAAGEIARASAGMAQLRIVAACDADPARAAAFAVRTGAALAPGIDALMAHPDVTTVYVGLPHHLLAPTVERALAAKKHVLAEKPLALDAPEARRLGDLAEARGLKLTVFFELRRAGTVAAARKLIADGAIGMPRLIRIRTIIDKRLDYWGQPGALNWRASKAEAGGGVVMMNTIHQLDTLRYITGLEIVRASAEIATMVAPAEVEDTASASLRLANGAIVSLVASAHSPGAVDEETIEIDGTLGRLDLPDPFSTAPLRLYRTADKTWSELAVERPDSHRLMLESFADAILRDQPVPAGAADAAAALATVRAIYRSAAEGRAVDIG